jgi:SAUR family protein
MMSLVKRRKLFLVFKAWRNRKLEIRHGCSLPALVALRSRNSMSSWHPVQSAASSDDDLDERNVSPTTPRGHLAVYVGQERQRFVIKTEYLHHPLFKKLLEEAEKEYGFENEGPLALPCQVAFFHSIMWMLQGQENEKCITAIDSPINLSYTQHSQIF